ncbi:MAG: DNA polymerase III subunit gamma/tau [Bacteroidia bacterium]|nr:DNA polymerase III subunit gamma/tau [Bacteroidia bacterium]MDW8347000.1 DNA polymerase III subunit gamma/tau [Bacteroidia bacterium]
MERYVVSARKYRPSTFDSVVGQSHITKTLRNAIKNNTLAHSFLFCGPRGVGKTTCARILAKTINCHQLTPQIEACNMCSSCVSFNQGTNLNIFELDAASNNSVEDIRNLIEQTRIPPQDGKYRIFIVDEVHMLSTAAFNAFLKTLEEPPSHAIFILATTEKHKILPTILSRCQKFDFKRIEIKDITEQLARIAEKENIQYEPEALHVIAQKADGGMRDALSIFDQLSNFTERNLTYSAVIQNLHVLDYTVFFQITDAILSQNHTQTLLLFNDILQNGFDAHHFLNGLIAHWRDLLLAQSEESLKVLELSEQAKKKYITTAQNIDTEYLLNAINVCANAEAQYKNSANPRILVELTLIKLCYLKNAIETAKLLQNIDDLKIYMNTEKKNPHPNTNVNQKTTITKTNTKVDIAAIRKDLQNPEKKDIKEKSISATATQNTAQNITLPDIPPNLEINQIWTHFKDFMRQKYNSENLNTALDNSYVEYENNVLTLFYIHTLKKWLIDDDEKHKLFQAYFKKALHSETITIQFEPLKVEVAQVPTLNQQKLQSMIALNPDFKYFIDALNIQFE